MINTTQKVGNRIIAYQTDNRERQREMKTIFLTSFGFVISMQAFHIRSQPTKQAPYIYYYPEQHERRIYEPMTLAYGEGPRFLPQNTS